MANSVSVKDFYVCGQKLSFVFVETLKIIKPGIRLIDIEKEACRLIKKSGGTAAFKTVPGYNWAVCANLDDGIVHGVPSRRVIKQGSLLSLDIGLKYRGWYTDMAGTWQVNGKKPPVSVEKAKRLGMDKFLQAGRKALDNAVSAARLGNRVGHISKAIQETIEANGYHCVRDLTGHGIGRNLHQFPWVPCVLMSPMGKTPVLEEGMGLAIEVIYAQSSPELKKADDGWTITTLDGKISALFEKTILVTKSNAKVITPYTWGQLIDFQ